MKNVITCKLSDVDVIFLYFFNLNCLSHVMIYFCEIYLHGSGKGRFAM